MLRVRQPMSLAIAIFYFAVLLALSAYGLHRLHLVLLCKRHEKSLNEFVASAPYAAGDELLPPVTVQLPLFNESTVAPRLLEAVAKLRTGEIRLVLEFWPIADGPNPKDKQRIAWTIEVS